MRTYLVMMGVLFVILWFGVTIYSMLEHDPNLFERAGSVGTVGLGLLLLWSSLVIDCGTYGEEPKVMLGRVFSSLSSQTLWFSFLIPLTTLQWGFGSMLFNFALGEKL